MNKTTVTALIIVVGLAIVGAAGYLIHHLTTGQMAM
jgi:preprotein translocase subunit Sss1